MLTMRRKKPAGDGKPTIHPATFPLRLPDGRLANALEEHAKRVKRSRNMAIVVLLEDAMRAEGLWPPADENDAGG